MSLDVYLYDDEEQEWEADWIEFSDNEGHMRFITRSEWDELFPGIKPVLRFRELLYEANITHNLNRMAEAAGIYKQLWRPDEIGVTRAGEIIDDVEKGLHLMQSDPERFEKFNASNG